MAGFNGPFQLRRVAARETVDVGEMRSALVGGSKMMMFLFDNYFVGQVVTSVFDEATRK